MVEPRPRSVDEPERSSLYISSALAEELHDIAKPTGVENLNHRNNICNWLLIL